jgi:flagella basal body P-ring formation protein FlgA
MRISYHHQTQSQRVSRRLLWCVAVGLIMMFARHVFGQPPARGAMQVTTTKTVERFVPRSDLDIASMEIRAETSVVGNDVTLRHVARWAEVHEQRFAEVADLVVLRLEGDRPFATVSIDQIRQLMLDSGFNPAMLNLSGAVECTINRSDIEFDEAAALKLWIEQGEARHPTTDQPAPRVEVLANLAQAQTAALEGKSAPVDADKPRDDRTLRQRLVDDLASSLPDGVVSLQVDFRPEDKPFLNLTSAMADFDVRPVRTGDVGPIAWHITITRAGVAKTMPIQAHARAWMNQVVARRPMSVKQLITEQDIEVKQTLVDRIGSDKPLKYEQIVGQQASRDLRVGTLMTSRTVDPVELSRPGEPITLIIRRGTLEVKSVGTAMGGGTYGTRIRVRNEATRQIFEATLAGPQLAIIGDEGTPLASTEE